MREEVVDIQTMSSSPREPPRGELCVVNGGSPTSLPPRREDLRGSKRRVRWRGGGRNPPEETPESATAILMEEVAGDGGPARAPNDGPPTSGELPPDTSRPDPEVTRYWSPSLGLPLAGRLSSNETATSRLRSRSVDADMDREATDLGSRKMSGPAGPDPATPGQPREAVEGTRSLPGKELPGEDKKQKASTKRKRGGEEDACSRLRPSKIQCTPPPRQSPTWWPSPFLLPTPPPLLLHLTSPPLLASAQAAP